VPGWCLFEPALLKSRGIGDVPVHVLYKAINLATSHPSHPVFIAKSHSPWVISGCLLYVGLVQSQFNAEPLERTSFGPPVRLGTRLVLVKRSTQYGVGHREKRMKREAKAM
jgi:hypothetical protein